MANQRIILILLCLVTFLSCRHKQKILTIDYSKGRTIFYFPPGHYYLDSLHIAFYPAITDSELARFGFKRVISEWYNVPGKTPIYDTTYVYLKTCDTSDNTTSDSAAFRKAIGETTNVGHGNHGKLKRDHLHDTIIVLPVDSVLLRHQIDSTLKVMERYQKGNYGMPDDVYRFNTMDSTWKILFFPSPSQNIFFLDDSGRLILGDTIAKKKISVLWH